MCIIRDISQNKPLFHKFLSFILYDFLLSLESRISILIRSAMCTILIPAKTSRDSGFGSGDPSPIHSQSPSGPSSLDNGHSADARRYFRSNSSPTANGVRSKKKTSKRPSKCCLLLIVASLFHICYCMHVFHVVLNAVCNMSCSLRKPVFLPMRKQRCRSASQKKLISAFIFPTWTVQFLFFLNLKFQASSLLLGLYRSVYVRPGWRP